MFARGWEKGVIGSECCWMEVSFWCDNSVQQSDSNDGGITTELYSLKEWILEYVNYFLVMLLLKKLSPAAESNILYQLIDWLIGRWSSIYNTSSIFVYLHIDIYMITSQ